MLCRNIGIIQHGELVENTSMKALLAKLKSETLFSISRRKAHYRSSMAISIDWSIPLRWKLKCCVSRDKQRIHAVK